MKYINYFLQFLFIRLTKCEERIIEEFDLMEISLMPDGSFAPGGRIKQMKLTSWYAIQGFVLPLTGWRNSFIYIGKKWFLKITKPKPV